MTRVAIVPEQSEQGRVTYRAIAGEAESTGQTAGEALDALTPLLPEEESGTLIVVQTRRPDRLFTLEQRQRLEDLMARWRAARDGGRSLPAAEQAELDRLVEAELAASAARAQALAELLAP